MSLIPGGFGLGRRPRVFDPFSLDEWDPFGDFTMATTPFFSTDLLVPRSSGVREAAAMANARFDWKETSDSHIFKADFPGMRKEEVKVELHDGRVLEISGERKREAEEGTDQWHRVERSHGKFARRFQLPENVKVDEIKAAMDNGVLTITVPKEAQPKSEVRRSIQISG